MTSESFDRQIRELSVRSLAYHEKCQSLWCSPPPPPHYGAPFLFAYVWSTWRVSDRQSLIESARRSVEQNIGQMLSQGIGSSGGEATREKNDEKMQLLLAACVPELFQTELFTELRPMAQLLQGVWHKPTKADRAAEARLRPKHISKEMAHIDGMPFVWATPVVQLIEQTLGMLQYRVFAAPEPLSPVENEMYQRDILLALRCFWLNLFCLQVFMQLSEHFHRTEQMLLARQSNAASTGDSAQEESKEPPARSGSAFRKPIHTMKIEEIVDEAIAAGTADEAQATTATIGGGSQAAAAATAAEATVPAAVPAQVYCAACHASPMAALMSVTAQPDQASILDPALKAANKQARVIELKRCGRCKGVWYCSVECQKAHYKQHKPMCKPPARTPSAEAPAMPVAAPAQADVGVD